MRNNFKDINEKVYQMKMSDFERIRLVLLGGAGVGKSSVVRRFLTKSYCDKYRPTVEDLHNREYDLGSVSLKVFNYEQLAAYLRPLKCGF